MPSKSFSEIASEVAETVERKNVAYGNSFDVSSEFLKLLWPNGVPPERYPDLLTITRMFDKLKRIATANDPDGESPYADLMGYALLALRRDAEEPEADGAGAAKLYQCNCCGYACFRTADEVLGHRTCPRPASECAPGVLVEVRSW